MVKNMVINSENTELTPRQHKAIVALISSKNIGKACEVAGISRTTMDRWLENDLFIQRLSEQKTRAIDATSRALLAGQEDALNVLRDLMFNATSEAVRRLAANDWLNHSQSFNGLAQFDFRLTQLELTVSKKVGNK